MKEIRKFDNSKKKYQDRKNYVEKVLNDVDVSEAVRGSLRGSSDHTYKKIENDLDELGTYLLKSHDVVSERKIEDSFYQREKDYYRRAIYKNAIHTDFYCEDNEFEIEENQKDLYIEYLFKLFNEADTTMKRNIVKAISSEDYQNLDDCTLKDFIKVYFEDYINDCRDGKDILVLNYLAKGLSDRESSKKLKVSQPAISKRIKKVIN